MENQNIIVVANQKGGVGKTTTAVSLAAYLADFGHDVLMVDLDPQANTSSGLGVEKHNLNVDIYHAITGQVAAPETMIHTEHGLALLPSSPVLAAAEVELVEQAGREFLLRKLLTDFTHDFIVIDVPPSLGLLTLNGLAAADHLIIPVQAEYYALEGLGQLLDTVQRVKQGMNPRLNLLGVLLTMHDSRTTLSDQVHEEVKKHFPEKVFDTVIPRNVRLAEAPSHGRPISTFSSFSKGARSYKKLTKEVIKRVS